MSFFLFFSDRTQQLASTSVVMSIIYAYSALQAPCRDTYLCCFAGKLSKSADVYAFGVLLWEMYTGQRPWSGLGQMQVIFHLTQRKKRLQFPSDTPPLLQVLPLLLLLVLYLSCCCPFLPIFCCLFFFFLSSTSSAAASSSPSSAASSSPSCPPSLLPLPLPPLLLLLLLPLLLLLSFLGPWSVCYQCKLAEEVVSVCACHHTQHQTRCGMQFRLLC